jgi:2-dehydro-3-deoxygluconokinase
MTRVDVLGIGEVMALLEFDGVLTTGTTYRLRLAGAETNLLIGVRRQGHRAALASALGDDPFGQFARDTLVSEGIEIGAVNLDPERRTGLFLKEVTTQERRRVWYYRDGSAASVYSAEPGAILDRLQPRVLVVSGLTLGLGPSDGLGATAVAFLHEAHARGVTTVFDVNLRPGIWAGDRAAQQFTTLREHLDVVLAGHEEMAELFPETDPLAAAVDLCEAGVRGVVIKDGARGAVAVDHGVAIEVPGLPVDRVVDPVGAGDAFAAGVTTGLLRGQDLATAATLGAVLGAEVVRHRGDWEGLPDHERAQALMASRNAQAGAV